ncbi:hypothetical protein LTS08_003294 [Lithohypha guttulata]|nr:hypothetical protein LTS08_003294 [Lithohypha guttulata]
MSLHSTGRQREHAQNTSAGVYPRLQRHSMGGIVAAETLLTLANEQPIPASTSKLNPDAPNFPSNTTLNSSTGTSHPNPAPDVGPSNFMFPHVQGILAFDTPFLGLAPEMIAHNLEGGHKFATSAFNTYNEVSSLFGWGGKDGSAASGASTPPKVPAGALPPPVSATNMADAAAAPRWSSWGKYAMFAGAAGAVAAGGAAALYSQREKISAGWGWASSHLLFVGDLAKAERLRQRVDQVNKQCVERGIGAANLYTNLGRGAREGYGLTETLSGRDRTFCNLPAAVKEGRDLSMQKNPCLKWIKTVNEMAKDETSAHMSMFYPKDNPGFYTLGEASKEIIASWIDQSWYKSSSGKADEEELDETINSSSIERDWEGLDKTAGQEGEGLQMREEELDDDKDPDTAMLEGSIIVDKSPSGSTIMESMAAEGKVPLPQSNTREL